MNWKNLATVTGPAGGIPSQVHVYVLGEPGNLRLEVVSKGQWCAHRRCTFTAKRNTLRFTPGS